MKIRSAILLAISLLSGCSTPTANHKYTALIRDKTVKSELTSLENKEIPSMDVDEVLLVQLLSAMVPTCSEELPDGSIKIIDPKNEIAQLRVSLHRHDLSFTEVYDILCQQSDLVWWVDKYVYIRKKE